MGCLKLPYETGREAIAENHFFLGKGYKKRASASKFCNSYYPFGLNHNTSWTRAGRENKYKYNAGSEENEITKNYEMYFRDYDPAIGRMMGIDPYAELYRGLNPYHYAANNPIMFNDPSGGLLMDMINDMFEMSSDGEVWENSGNGGFTSDRGNSVNASNYGWNGSDWGSGSSVNNPHTSNGRYYWKRNRFGNVSYKWKPGKVNESNSLRTNLSDAVSNVFDSDTFTSIYQNNNNLNSNNYNSISTFSSNVTWSDDPLYAENGDRVVAHTTLDTWKSNYTADRTSINFVFSKTYDNVIKSDEFKKSNGDDYYLAVEYHEQAHIDQYMDIVNSSSFTYEGEVGTFADILFNSDLTGNEFDDLFYNMMIYVEDLWSDLNDNDPGHSDANDRARRKMDKKLHKHTYRKPKF